MGQLKRNTKNANSNAFLEAFNEFLDLVGRVVTIYELYKFFKKHRILIAKIVFLGCVGFPIFVGVFFFSLLRRASPKRFREFFNLHRIFRIQLIREAVIPFLFVLLNAVA